MRCEGPTDEGCRATNVRSTNVRRTNVAEQLGSSHFELRNRNYVVGIKSLIFQ